MSRPTIGQAELEVLSYIADHPPATVREVADHLATTKGQSRTTALSMMERLRRKGFITRDRDESGVYRYAPSSPKSEVMRGLVGDFLERTLGGSVSPFVAYLSEEAELSDAQVAELKRMVERLEARRGEGKV
ncbi:MAG TPA: BlaI/MecI/CopY family transcriptional regulator [Armatimonadota bacterium]|jgi:predicted transcriptional regulator